MSDTDSSSRNLPCSYSEYQDCDFQCFAFGCSTQTVVNQYKLQEINSGKTVNGFEFTVPAVKVWELPKH